MGPWKLGQTCRGGADTSFPRSYLILVNSVLRSARPIDDLRWKCHQKEKSADTVNLTQNSFHIGKYVLKSSIDGVMHLSA